MGQSTSKALNSRKVAPRFQVKGYPQPTTTASTDIMNYRSESRQTFPSEWLEQPPSKNLAIIKAEAMSDGERYQEGFRDGQRGRGNRKSLHTYSEYQRGYSDGRKRRDEYEDEI